MTDERRDGYDRRVDTVTWRTMHDAFKEHNAEIEKKQGEILNLLRGDGSDNRPGLLTRVDRIEQDAKRAQLTRRTQNGFHAIWFSAAVAYLFKHFGGS